MTQLERQQRGLLDLIKNRGVPPEDPYLRQVANSRELEMVREIAIWWRAFQIEDQCRFTSRTGCGLILDAYNLECDAYNQGLNISAFLDELNLAPVRELHLAGGVQRRGFHLDIHSNPTRDSTLDLGLDIIRRTPNLDVVTYEFLKEAVVLLGHDGICNELVRIRQAIQQ